MDRLPLALPQSINEVEKTRKIIISKSTDKLLVIKKFRVEIENWKLLTAAVLLLSFCEFAVVIKISKNNSMKFIKLKLEIIRIQTSKI